jgi:hypothetical protein
MEKIESVSNVNVVGGDNDDSVDWEDFIIISGKVIDCFNIFRG